MANVGDVLTTIETGMQRIDDRNINFIYTDCDQDSITANYNGTRALLQKPTSIVEFYVYTSKIYFYADDYNNYRVDNFQVEIDGTIENVVYTHKNYINKSIIQYINTSLEKKIHHIKVYSNEASASFNMTFDCIDIDDDGCMIYWDDNNKLYYDVTPIMTSNTAPAPYVASASSYWSSSLYLPYTSFNSSLSYYWFANSPSNQWIKIMLNNDKKFNAIKFELTASYVNNGAIFKKMDIQISEDDSSYETIYQFDNCDKTFWGKYINGNQFCFVLNLPQKIYKPKYVRFYLYSNNGNSTYATLGEVNFLLQEKSPFYLVEDNNNHYNYDENTDSLVEVTDTSILNANALENTCIYDLNKILPLVSNVNDIHLISNQNVKLTVNGIKSDKELVVSNENLSITSAETIKQYIPTVTKTGNGELYTVVSNDNGTTWKTWNASSSSWEDLTNVCPLDAYKGLTSEQLTKWNTFRDEVATSGINSTDIASANFELLRSSDKRLKFAFVLKRPTYEDGIVLKDLQWLIDKVGGWIKLDENDIKIKVTTTNCEVTALQDNMQNVKVNILI